MEEAEFGDFFSDVFQHHCQKFSVVDKDIMCFIRMMHFAYSKDGQELSDLLEPVYYDSPAARCGYLFKYAGFHAAMLADVLSHPSMSKVIRQAIPGGDEAMKICCLGGGPGTDIIGLSNVLAQSVEKIHLTTIECMPEWCSAMEDVLEVAGSGKYRFLNEFLSGILSNTYIDLSPPESTTWQALESSDLLTLVKFVSALKKKQAPKILEGVFGSLKTGAVVLFIDNAGGGFHKMVTTAAF